MPDRIKRLVLEGTEQNRRFRIVVNGEDRWLTLKSFTYLVRLAVAGKLHKRDLEPVSPKQAQKYVSRLRKEDGITIEYMGRGYYRLDVLREVIHFNHHRLAHFKHDTRIRDLFQKGRDSNGLNYG